MNSISCLCLNTHIHTYIHTYLIRFLRGQFPGNFIFKRVGAQLLAYIQMVFKHCYCFVCTGYYG